MPREPHHLTPIPDGRSLLVGDASGNQMLFLDPNTGEVQKRLPITDPFAAQSERMDRIDLRLERIERRLEIVAA